MTQTDDNTPRINCPKTLLTRIWRPRNISPPKVEKPTSGTELYTIMQILTPISARIGPRCIIYVPGQRRQGSVAQQALANELAWRKDQLGCNLRMLRWR